nr:transporter substrate-binding domain-containing protein [Nafulsella turpanensis]
MGSLLLPVLGCRPSGSEANKEQQADLLGLSFLEEPVKLDLEEIKERGRLIAIVDNSSTSYFIYKGQPMGYEYELLSRLADNLKVDLEIIITSDIEEAFAKLNRGEGDIIAHNLTVTKERQEHIDFTLHHNEVRQVLVQRKPKNWRKMKLHQIEESLIRNPLELGNKTVYVRKASAFYNRLQHLSAEIGEDINIVEDTGDAETEEMIRKVANGEIDYTVADEDVALLNAAYYPNLDVETAISFPQKIAWGVRKSSPELLKAINSWIREMRKETDYYVIYNKYFKNRSGMRRLASSSYSSINGNQISPYDTFIKEAAADIGWDWRLMAAIIYQESKFNPEAESWMGATGLMQLMPETAEIFGAEDPLNPRQNIRAGASYLKWLDDFWTDEIQDPEERKKFVLASYNVGQGHVLDARRLAVKYGKDPQVWEDNVEYFLERKATPKYYTDEVVKYGYCRGSEPVKYVNSIMRRTERYKQLIQESPGEILAKATN